MKQLPRLAEPILGVPAYAVLWIAVVMSLFGVLVALAWRDGFRPVLPRMEFAFLCLVMYLCSPDSRWAHEMQLLAPFMALAALAARLRPFSRSWPAPPGWRLAAGVVIGAGVLFQVVVTSDIVGAPLDQSARALSTHFLFVMGLAVLLALVQLSRRTARPAGLRAKDDPLGLRAEFPIEGLR